MWTFILFFVILLTGFWLGRRHRSQDSHLVSIQISKNYFKGLNHLLNEENDKALDTFIKSMSVDGDTIETHLALGGLFRRRGELTRAIRVHQNLLARPTLTSRERAQAQLALAHDYLAAGMLDRAEQNFLEVADTQEFQEESWQRLLDIYEREKRWRQAIEIALKFEATDPEVRLALAHHYCELAQYSIKKNNLSFASEMLKKARKYQRRLARIDLLNGSLWMSEGKWEEARQAYQRVAEQDPDYLSETLSPIKQCYEKLQDETGLKKYLFECQKREPRISTAIALTEILFKETPEEAVNYLKSELKLHPSLRGVVYFIELQKKMQSASYNERFDLQTFYDIAMGILKKTATYRCKHCGFSGRILFWQCPSCKRWSSMRPIHGLEGD